MPAKIRAFGSSPADLFDLFDGFNGPSKIWEGNDAFLRGSDLLLRFGDNLKSGMRFDFDVTGMVQHLGLASFDDPPATLWNSARIWDIENVAVDLDDLTAVFSAGIDTPADLYAFTSLLDDGDGIDIRGVAREFKYPNAPDGMTFIGGANADTLHGRDGDDYFFATPGADHLSGGGGIDTLDFSVISDLSSDGVVVVQKGRTKAVVDGVQQVAADAFERFVLTDNDDVFWGNIVEALDAGAGDDEIAIKGALTGSLDTGEGDDRVRIGRYSRPGENRGDIDLGAGDDDVVMDSQAGYAAVRGGDGNDMLGFYVFNYVGAEGGGSLFGGHGNDTLSGAKGDETLLGGAGADELDGREGTNVLIGGAGRDTFVVGQKNVRIGVAPDEVTTISDYEIGEVIRARTDGDIATSQDGGDAVLSFQSDGRQISVTVLDTDVGDLLIV